MKDNFTPTEEQLAIIEAVKKTNDNILVEALAGAAKTSTLVLIANAIYGQAILSIAFNKSIATEMKKRLPTYCESKTLNSIGHSAWSKVIGRRLEVASDKSHNIFKAFAETKKSRSSDLWDLYPEIRTAFRLARQNGYIPADAMGGGHPLLSQDEFYGSLEEEPDNLLIDCLEYMLCESIKQAYHGLIDFDDQIYMPTLFGGIFPNFPTVLGDEVQDWSFINQVMLEKLAKGRLIAVGDPYQSIYGFRGAVQSGMDRLAERFNMRRLGLSVTFRCPRSVVRNAHWRVPHMKYPDWAEEGICEDLDELHVNQVPDGAVFICRNNAPLFSVAMDFIRTGRGVQILGADIGPGLIKVLEKLGDRSISRDAAIQALDNWKEAKKKKSRSHAALEDRYECLLFFIQQGQTLSEGIEYAKHLFKQQGPVIFCSGHKSKGLEWDTVYHLDSWRIPSKYATTKEEIEQEKNVRYVIETRAKKALYRVNSDAIKYGEPK